MFNTHASYILDDRPVIGLLQAVQERYTIQMIRVGLTRNKSCVIY